MPQRAQNPLIHVLLMWTTILSIVQAVFIILFFTMGHHGEKSQNSSVVALQRTMQSPANNAPSVTPPIGLLLGKGQMLTFKATEVCGKIEWQAKNPSESLVSEDLTIKQDGYYFLNLQVTLTTPCQCNGPSNCTVSLSYNGKVLLQGWINRSTCSTGLLGKVVVLNGGSPLNFTSKLPDNQIDEAEPLTHLDIIYIDKP